MKHRILFGVALCGALGAGLLAQQPAAPASAVPAAPREEISGIWNRLDTAGAGSWGGLAYTFPVAQLKPEFAAKLPPQDPNFDPATGIGTPPPGWAPPAYNIADQAPAIPRCNAIGAAAGGRRGGGGGSGPIMPDSLGISIMADANVAVFLSDGAQGATRRVPLDGRRFQDPSRVPGVQSYGYWDNGVLTIKSRGFASGMVGYGRGWTEPTTELTETLKLSADGNRMVWTYTYEDPNVYIKPHAPSVTYERLPVNQYVFENFCDSKAWFDDQAKQAVAGRAGGAAAPAAGRGRGAGQ